MNTIQQQKAARDFATHWEGKGYEKGESQIFWTTLLNQVFGIEHPETFIIYEHQVKLDHTSFIDGFIPTTKVMIEQKSLGKNLGEGIKQSDGSVLNPFQQAKRYAAELPYSQRPRWIVTSNFAQFWVYDMEQPNGEPQKILLKDLEKEYYRLQFLVDEGNEHLKREMEVSVKAGELVGIIYDKLLEQYGADDPETLRSLNILCVRLVFCLYAEDAGLFNSRTSFHDYLHAYPAQKLRRALVDLFAILDTPLAERDKYLEDDLAAFPYVNGGLFSDKTIEIPPFTDEIKQLLLEDASSDFDWSEISPTIFGAVFESTLNPETRRSGGMHYTSIENIHKVIDPLFLYNLKAEFEGIMRTSMSAQKRYKLQEFQNKLSSLTFFDPACGSGNFLTETFLSLRRLENEVIKAMYGDTRQFDFGGTIKVNISQFYGIEINDFACTVAKTALWIAESQTLKETSHIVGVDLNFLPLKTNAYIHEGNALRMDWASLFRPSTDITSTEKTEKAENISVPSASSVDNIHYPDYIIGNPPFVGYSLQTKEQKEDVLSIYVDEKGKPYKTAGKIDYVAAWYWKAAELMQKAASIVPDTIRRSPIRAALVSTNSITQGEQVAAIWQPLFERFGIQIDFAYRTFRWDSEADIKAHVHCVIIGFSLKDTIGIPKGYEKKIYLSDNQVVTAQNINPYLTDAPIIWITARQKPLCQVPEMLNGGKPVEGGFLILTEDERNELLAKEPQAAPLLRPYMMGKDFIERKPRYCLWLVGANPSLLRQCHEVMRRVQSVKKYRLSSPKEATRKAAETPTLFAEVRECPSDYIAIPKVSSENRRYIPMEYLSKDIIAGDKLFMIPDASLYMFGVLTSNVHMAWMRATCGRLEMRYSYSNTIVYNNFPWPSSEVARLKERTSCVEAARTSSSSETQTSCVSDAMRQRIEQTAQAILDARAKYPDCSLADLYDEVTMPPELRKAHQENDRAVMAAYGFSTKMTESECVAELFKRYHELATKANL